MPKYQVFLSTEYLSFSEKGEQAVDFRMVQPITVRATCKKQAITLAQKVLIRKHNPTSWGLDDIKKVKS